MTGPEHYVEAERLLQFDADAVAAAQVHATLALTAATVDAAGRVLTSRRAEWQEATA